MNKFLQKYIILFILITIISSTVYGLGDTVRLYWDNPIIETEEEVKTLNTMATRYNKTTYLPVDEFGMVSAEAVKNAIKDTTILVTIMTANIKIEIRIFIYFFLSILSIFMIHYLYFFVNFFYVNIE